MQSKWKGLKEKAIALRKSGCSLKDVEGELGIARSTLSGWFKNIELTAEQNEQLHDRWKNALVEARKHAKIWHTKEKDKRLAMAQEAAQETLSLLNIQNKQILELSLAMLYLGEGSKKGSGLSMGNSNPEILRFFVDAVCKLYNLVADNIRFDLHLRADQDPEEIKKYWAKELDISINQFATVSFDKRTIGRPTYPNYKGVCVANCGNIAIQRKLVYLGKAFCSKITRV